MGGRTIAISGTWRVVTAQMEQDVRAAVKEIADRGDALVCGGALGVDYLALDEMLRHDPRGERITVVLATSLFSYIGRLTAWAAGQEDPLARERVDNLVALLGKLKEARPELFESMAEIEPQNLMEEHYLACNDRIVELADELMAFQVNQSSGTQDAIDKMRAAGKPVSVRSYTV